VVLVVLSVPAQQGRPALQAVSVQPGVALVPWPALMAALELEVFATSLLLLEVAATLVVSAVLVPWPLQAAVLK
jgi:hypothetical protein